MSREEPSSGFGDVVERTLLFEQVTRTSDDDEFVRSTEMLSRATIEVEHFDVATSHEEQNRLVHLREMPPRKIRATTA